MLKMILVYKQISALLPFLNIEETWENFKTVGNVPVDNILLQI
jgi:hypothetical protein